MLKTNNKQVKEAVRKYLTECNEEVLNRYEVEGIEKPFTFVKNVIINEIGSDTRYRQMKNVFHSEMLKDYIQGCSYGDQYYHVIYELIKEWLQETEEEARQYENKIVHDEPSYIHLYFYLVYREFDYMLRKESEVK